MAARTWRCSWRRGPADAGCGDQIRGIDAAGRWVQYRLALGAVNGGNTPRVSEVRVSYG